MGFVKLDCAILDSTVYIDRDVRDVFITALLMAVPRDFDEDITGLNISDLAPSGFVIPRGFYGMVEASGPGIIRRAGLDQAAGMKALEALCNPETESRSRDFDGRRMVRIDGGYLILNYGKYRERDYGAAERMRALRARRKSNGVTPNGYDVTPNTSRTVTHAEAEAEAEPREDPPSLRSGGPGGAEVLNGQHEQGYRENPALPHDAEAAKTGRKQGKRLASRRVPEDFAITPKLRQLEVELPDDFDLDGETSKFRDHEFRVAHSDWPATWRKWMRTARDDKRYAKKRVQRWE